VVSTTATSGSGAPCAGIDLDALVLVIETGLRVGHRHQFFNWTQGPLQSLLPHDLLVCALADHDKHGYRIDTFSCYPVPELCLKNLNDPEHGMLSRLAHAWVQNDRQPLIVNGDSSAAAPVAQFTAELARYELGNLVAHGTYGLNGMAGSFFGFYRTSGRIDCGYAHIVEVLVPYLHVAWLRSQYQEKTPVRQRIPAPLPKHGLTNRELEVLTWVHEGKSNAEIGLILSISRLTVKNHVQKILRKLNAQNRAQAVAKALTNNFLQNALR
jgi:transcriptional regulator EpsA